MKTKEQLEQEINELNELLTQSVATKDNISTQLEVAQQELAESKMPTMTRAIRNIIREAVNSAVCGYDFNDSREFTYDFEIDYDNRLSVSNLEFDNRDNLEESICEYIEENFKIIEDAE